MRQTLTLIVIVSALLTGCASATPSPAPALPGPSAEVPTQAATVAPSSATATPGNGWQVFRDSNLRFEIQYPPGGQILDMGDGAVRINLPVAAGTNLTEKFFQVNPSTDTANCTSSLGPGPVEPVEINGVTLNRAVGGEGVAGSVYEYVGYALVNGSTCLNMQFTLHYTDMANYATPPAEFDRAAETQVFDQMLATFRLTQ